MTIERLSTLYGISLFPAQVDAVQHALSSPEPLRACYYYPTGAGKSITALLALSALGVAEAVVIAPPSTHESWEAQAALGGIKLTLMSHATFRQKTTKLSRSVALVCDEAHLLGGHKAKGWGKLDRIAPGIQAPVILMSATPQYNDAERVYCIQHVLDPKSLPSGYLSFLYKHCEVEPSFRGAPTVTGFHRFDSAADYLNSLPQVLYIPDEAVYTVEDSRFYTKPHEATTKYGWDSRKKTIMHSLMTQRVQDAYWQLFDDNDQLRVQVYDWLKSCLQADEKPSLIYCNYSTVAQLVHDHLSSDGFNVELMTGKSTAKQKQAVVDRFRAGSVDVLISTATLATGTDGFDKVSDTLVLLQDTPDDSLRRQLVGRILPRGTASNYSDKKFFRAIF